mmetsp:Transcript_17520/g.49723  ORF Transcript_17520/g.49723 Transcript_17520/m.49723 type:complete len:387 (-) Transcript_17520:701-1861(-)
MQARPLGDLLHDGLAPLLATQERLDAHEPLAHCGGCASKQLSHPFLPHRPKQLACSVPQRRGEHMCVVRQEVPVEDLSIHRQGAFLPPPEGRVDRVTDQWRGEERRLSAQQVISRLLHHVHALDVHHLAHLGAQLLQMEQPTGGDGGHDERRVDDGAMLAIHHPSRVRRRRPVFVSGEGLVGQRDDAVDAARPVALDAHRQLHHRLPVAVDLGKNRLLLPPLQLHVGVLVHPPQHILDGRRVATERDGVVQIPPSLAEVLQVLSPAEVLPQTRLAAVMRTDLPDTAAAHHEVLPPSRRQLAAHDALLDLDTCVRGDGILPHHPPGHLLERDRHLYAAMRLALLGLSGRRDGLWRTPEADDCQSGSRGGTESVGRAAYGAGGGPCWL